MEVQYSLCHEINQSIEFEIFEYILIEFLRGFGLFPFFVGFKFDHCPPSSLTNTFMFSDLNDVALVDEDSYLILIGGLISHNFVMLGRGKKVF